MSDVPETMPQPGKAAPAFTLPAVVPGEDEPTKIRLSQFKGDKHVLLYFYPRDNTPGCTQEACDFRDSLASLESAGVAVLGVSTDPPKSHRKFADKFELPFPLLSDEDAAVCRKYGTWVVKKMYGKESEGVQRATFLIGKDGKVKRVWPKVRVKGHVGEVLESLALPD